MSKSSPNDGSRFTVDLGSIRLSPVLEKQVETGIRTVVLEALAGSNNGGVGRLGRSIFDKFPGRTLGLWLDPYPTDPTRPPNSPLIAEDHTRIVEAVMRTPFDVIRYLDVGPGTPPPSDLDVLKAALRVGRIDEGTKDRIRMTIDILTEFEKAGPSMSRDVKGALLAIKERVSGQPIEKQIKLLRSPDFCGDFKHDGLVEGMAVAAEILEDGAGTIYSADYGFYGTISDDSIQKKDNVDDVKDADYLGGVGGAAAGLILSGVGAAPGAVAGAAGASVGAVLGKVIEWLW